MNLSSEGHQLDMLEATQQIRLTFQDKVIVVDQSFRLVTSLRRDALVARISRDRQGQRDS